MQPESFTYVIVGNLRQTANEEVPREVILQNFNRVANHIKAMYFYFLGFGPFHGRFFGGSLPLIPQENMPRSLEEVKEQTKLKIVKAGPHGCKTMNPPLPLSQSGDPMAVKVHVFFKCEPSGSTDSSLNSTWDAGLPADSVTRSTLLRPELVRCLEEHAPVDVPQASVFRHRWCALPRLHFQCRFPSSASSQLCVYPILL
jgi:hypothetical protein